MSPYPDALTEHLRRWVGSWPPQGPGLQVVEAGSRTAPGWDGAVRRLRGVSTPDAGVVGVAPDLLDAVRAALHGVAPGEVDDDHRRAVAAAAGPGLVLGRGAMRWSTTAPDTDQHPDAGEWVRPDDPRVPAWLHPFNDSHVLVAWDDRGEYGAGVGIKVHDDFGAEVAVVTEPALRGRGLARRLVAQAMRRIVGRGQVVTYLHAPDNAASAAVAEAVGLADRGWSVWGLFEQADLP